MRNSSLPHFHNTEYSVDLRRKDRRRSRQIPTVVLVIIGIYIGFLSYYLVVEDALGLAPATDAVVESTAPMVEAELIQTQ
ncbi:MAG: hypothetical protein AAGF33_13725 [Pseudomonadota bacterium]